MKPRRRKILTLPNCVHWWVIDSELQGVCRKCGVTKDFAKLQEEAGIITKLKTQRKERRASFSGVRILGSCMPVPNYYDGSWDNLLRLLEG